MLGCVSKHTISLSKDSDAGAGGRKQSEGSARSYLTATTETQTAVIGPEVWHRLPLDAACTDPVAGGGPRWLEAGVDGRHNVFIVECDGGSSGRGSVRLPASRLGRCLAKRAPCRMQNRSGRLEGTCTRRGRSVLGARCSVRSAQRSAHLSLARQEGTGTRCTRGTHVAAHAIHAVHALEEAPSNAICLSSQRAPPARSRPPTASRSRPWSLPAVAGRRTGNPFPPPSRALPPSNHRIAHHQPRRRRLPPAGSDPAPAAHKQAGRGQVSGLVRQAPLQRSSCVAVVWRSLGRFGFISVRVELLSCLIACLAAPTGQPVTAR